MISQNVFKSIVLFFMYLSNVFKKKKSFFSKINTIRTGQLSLLNQRGMKKIPARANYCTITSGPMHSVCICALSSTTSINAV